MSKSPNIRCPSSREEDESHRYFIFHCQLPKTTLDFIRELINLTYTFTALFKVSRKANAIKNGGFWEFSLLS